MPNCGEVELVRFVGSLTTAAGLDELERTFAAGFHRVVDAALYGYARTGRARLTVTVNVSDAFVARYEHHARDIDPVRARALDTRRPAYNLAMMSPEEWEVSPVYRRAYSLHRIRHVVAVPVIGGDRVIGCLHLAESDPERPFRPRQIALAEAVAEVLGETIDRLCGRERLQRERDEALAALELTATPIVVSAPELQLNAAARGLLADVVEGEEQLYRLLARPGAEGAFARRLEVELASGQTGVLHAASAAQERGLVTVLELQRDEPGISPRALAVLTPREAEVATLIADGLADREIAGQLHLSHHTVSQYAKRIYRKVDVDSRVGLTRLLLGDRSSSLQATSRARASRNARSST